MKHLVASPTTIRRMSLLLATVVLAVVSSAIHTRAQSDAAALTATTGAQADGTTLLPNGWRLGPAGRQLRVGSLPLNIVLSPDGRYAVVTGCGRELCRRARDQPRRTHAVRDASVRDDAVGNRSPA
jgi:hypothetical protein